MADDLEVSRRRAELGRADHDYHWRWAVLRDSYSDPALDALDRAVLNAEAALALAVRERAEVRLIQAERRRG